MGEIQAQSLVGAEDSVVSVQPGEAGCTEGAAAQYKPHVRTGNPSKLRRILTLPRAQCAIRRFTQTIALFLRQVALPRMLAERPEPSFLTNTATAGARAMACGAVTGRGERRRRHTGSESHNLKKTYVNQGNLLPCGANTLALTTADLACERLKELHNRVLAERDPPECRIRDGLQRERKLGTN